MSDADATEPVRRFCDKTAVRYDGSIQVFERLLFAGGRRWVCSRAHGDVLEIAAGTGRNFPYYPADARLSAVEFSSAMLAMAHRRAERLHVTVNLRLGDAQALDFPDRRFDAVVSTLSLCTIPDDRLALAEARRVLRPGGRLLLLGHVRSAIQAVRIGQRLLDPLATRFEGDHLLREPLDYLADLGFAIDECERSKWGIVELVAARKTT